MPFYSLRYEISKHWTITGTISVKFEWANKYEYSFQESYKHNINSSSSRKNEYWNRTRVSSFEFNSILTDLGLFYRF